MGKLAAMNFHEISWQIQDLLDGVDSVFLRTEPDVPDFTSRSPFKILVYNTNQQVTLEVNPQNIAVVVGILDATVFNKEIVKRLYTWNLKGLATYFHRFVPRFVTPTTSVIDLKIIEAFLGIKKNRPENFVEAINRTKIVVRHKSWQTLYQSIHLPLALRVLPTIETTPLLNETSRKPEYPYYEIEGQANGRMNCAKKFAYSYLPHTMGPDVKQALKPKGYNFRFLAADFRHCEVTVLQWLTNDERLKEILDSGEDLHKRIYEIVTGDPCDSDNKRNISKLLFLPVMYGLSPKGLARNLKLPETVGGELHNRIRTNFSTAYNQMVEVQKRARQGPVEDHFGRIRKFAESEPYKARNFWVQGVAATVCQEKLIDLYKALDGENAYLAYSVHDGYCICFRTPFAKQAYQIVRQTLEAPSRLCEGLEMKVEIKFGAKLDSMKVLWK